MPLIGSHVPHAMANRWRTRLINGIHKESGAPRHEAFIHIIKTRVSFLETGRTGTLGLSSRLLLSPPRKEKECLYRVSAGREIYSGTAILIELPAEKICSCVSHWSEFWLLLRDARDSPRNASSAIRRHGVQLWLHGIVSSTDCTVWFVAFEKYKNLFPRGKLELVIPILNTIENCSGVDCHSVQFRQETILYHSITSI